MAKIIVDGQEMDVADNASFQKEAESLGIPFGCTEGICETCRCKVVSGMENLTPKTQEEIDAEVDDDERLLCQCQIKSGVVEFKYW